jgi:hypothetical protein
MFGHWNNDCLSFFRSSFVFLLVVPLRLVLLLPLCSAVGGLPW